MKTVQQIIKDTRDKITKSNLKATMGNADNFNQYSTISKELEDQIEIEWGIIETAFSNIEELGEQLHTLDMSKHDAKRRVVLQV